MRFERLDENKLKVIIDNDELEKWDIDVLNIPNNSQAIQKMFWYAMKQAASDIGFEANGSHLVVEAVSEGDNNNFSMIITKVDEDYANEILKIKSRKRKKSSTGCCKQIYKFSDFDIICEIACNININFVKESSLYKHDGNFYLEILPKNPSAASRLDAMIIEFSQRPDGSIGSGTLREHGKLLIDKNALEILCKHFNKSA